MGLFHHKDSDEAQAHQAVSYLLSYSNLSVHWSWSLHPTKVSNTGANDPHKSKLSHELIAAAAAYEVHRIYVYPSINK
jgi:hypothetical protein